MKHPSDIQLIELSSGCLAEETAMAVRAHLATCEECRARAEQLAESWERLGCWQVGHGTRDIADRVLAAAREEIHGRSVVLPYRWRMLLRTAAVIAVAALAGHLAARLRPVESAAITVENSYVAALAMDHAGSLTAAALLPYPEEPGHE